MGSFNWEFDFDQNCPLYAFKYAPRGDDRLHWHDYYEIGVCVKGRGQYLCLNKVYPIEKGDIFVANNFENHVALPDEQENLQFIFLIFLPQFFTQSHRRQIDQELLASFNYDPRRFTNRIQAATKTAQRIKKTMRQIYREYEQTNSFRLIRLDILTRQLLLEINEHYAVSASEPETDGEADSRIIASQQFIADHLHEKLRLSDVAEHVELSPSYFRHLFREETKISYQEYLTKMRLARAIRLLISSSHTIGAIMEMSGFSNSSLFYRLFRQETSISPHEFRQRYRYKSVKSG